MENSILTSTKKMLGLAADYTAFDLDVITHINTAFSALTQLGIGWIGGFMIEDDTKLWTDFVPLGEEDDLTLNAIKTYIFLKTRFIFDPPSTSYAIAAFEKQIEQIEWRLSVNREGHNWVDPDPPNQDPPIAWYDYFYGDQLWSST